MSPSVAAMNSRRYHVASATEGGCLSRNFLTELTNMARKTASRIQLRKEAEAAESRDDAKKTKKASAKKKAARPRKKAKSAERKRLVWGLFSNTLKEEGRFPYDQRKEAEERLEQLLARGKKIYFMQALKEPLSGEPTAPLAAADKPVRKKKKKKSSDEEE